MALDTPLTRRHLADLAACRRRFQLRYLDRLPWPAAPQAGEPESGRRLGEEFHRLLQRHFLGLPPDEDALRDERLRRWWLAFQRHGPRLPAGRALPELSLTVPIGGHLLTGRFDLLVMGEDEAHIFDWKTEQRPRSEGELAEDLQSRLYLALLAEGGAALRGGRPLDPAGISLTYWYASDPAATVTFTYDAGQHGANRAGLQGIMAGLDSWLATAGEWPLTDDLAECGRCAYQVFCDRMAAALPDEGWEGEEEPLAFEPDTP